MTKPTPTYDPRPFDVRKTEALANAAPVLTELDREYFSATVVNEASLAGFNAIVASRKAAAARLSSTVDPRMLRAMGVSAEDIVREGFSAESLQEHTDFAEQFAARFGSHAKG